MEIILGKTAGFCNGITRAVEKAEEELQKVDKIDCLGDRKSTRLNSSHSGQSRMPSSA